MLGSNLRARGLLLLVLIALIAIPAIVSAAPGARLSNGGITDALLQSQLAAEGRANIFVKMAADANLSRAEGIQDKVARRWFVHDTLTAQAASSQADIQSFLDSQGMRYVSFWINNSIYVYNADAALVRALAQRADVAYVRGDHEVPLNEPVRRAEAEAPEAVEWGVIKINADDVWAQGNTGEGIVVANIDTGARYTHQALVNNYRGNTGGGFNHDYDWWDPDMVAGAPQDNNGHGTHTIGTIAGGDGPGPFTNDIGVAPGSRWIAAQGCDTNSCSDFDLTSSAQWIACPTRVDGTVPDCSMAPDVVNNSWGGGNGDPWYQTYVDAWLAAGVVPVFAVHNYGPSCNTATSPGDYSNVIGVGATDVNDVLANFSGRGPGAFRPLKPDMVAPGVNVRSSVNSSDTAYANYDGTSMATPHVAGAVALMLADTPNLTLRQIYVRLALTANRTLGDPPNPDVCGDRAYDDYPSYHYGFGRIDVLRAVNAGQ